MRLTKRTTLPAWILFGLVTAGLPVHAQDHADEATTGPASRTLAQTGADLRDLWVGHIFWVRNVAVETLAGDAAAAAAAENEVVANAKQIAASVEPFYGKAASEKLFDLLAAHYGAIKQYLEATAAGNQTQQDAAMKSLTDNAGEIAVFLSGANPNLPRDTVQGLFVAHGGHHVQQIQQLLGKEYQQEAQTWDAMRGHMYVIADALAGALAKQFPAKFS